ncbi:MAG: glycosyltransferase, partial [Armatimonadota bacterium]
PNGAAPLKGYYIQDFEPRFFPKDSREHRSAWRSYTRFPDLVRFTKTEWNRDMVRDEIHADAAVVGPSVDIDIYRPRRRRDPDWPHRPLRLAAMIRPATPRRQAQLTMQVLKELSRAHGDTIEVHLFGCWPDDHDFLQLPRDFPWRHAGVLTRNQLSAFFNEIDIFVDLSSWQAMGLSAMEAMACGAAAIAPLEGGASSFARNGENALLVDTSSQEACAAALERLIMDEQLRRHLQAQAIVDVCEYPPERAAYRILESLFLTRQPHAV